MNVLVAVYLVGTGVCGGCYRYYLVVVLHKHIQIQMVDTERFKSSVPHQKVSLLATCLFLLEMNANSQVMN